MSYEAKILKDSISPNGNRLTSFEVTFPRFILAELNTHRMLSRNSASSRAIPPEKIIERVTTDPFVPEFNKRVKGMGVGEPLNESDAVEAHLAWIDARDQAIGFAEQLLNLDVDKSRINRLLEPFMWHTAILSATEWSNLFALRTAEDAQPEFRKIARMMLELYETNEPQAVGYGAWHLPLVTDEEIHEGYPEYNPQDTTNWERHWDYWKKISTGRCARVSYLTHDGRRDPDLDVVLHDRLFPRGHMSPFEHIATPIFHKGEHSGNFIGWHQYRKDFPYEDDFAKVLEAQ